MTTKKLRWRDRYALFVAKELKEMQERKTVDTTAEDNLKRLNAINTIIHDFPSMQIMTQLYITKTTELRVLAGITKMTRFKLMILIEKLSIAGYIILKKKKEFNLDNDMVEITDEGKAAFREHRKALKHFIDLLPKDKEE